MSQRRCFLIISFSYKMEISRGREHICNARVIWKPFVSLVVTPLQGPVTSTLRVAVLGSLLEYVWELCLVILFGLSRVKHVLL